jgi:hypothetical protein
VTETRVKTFYEELPFNHDEAKEGPPPIEVAVNSWLAEMASDSTFELVAFEQSTVFYPRRGGGPSFRDTGLPVQHSVGPHHQGDEGWQGAENHPDIWSYRTVGSHLKQLIRWVAFCLWF